MDYRTALLAEHSKALTLRIIADIGTSPKRFAQLLEIALGDDPRIDHRAAWAVSHCAVAQPDLVRPHLGRLLRHLRKPDIHPGITRSVMKSATLLFPIPDEEVVALLVDTAFGYLASPDSPIATKVYSMSVIARICEDEPALTDELRLHIQELLRPPKTPPAIRSRARTVLRQLDG